jgi:D-alanine-D-alanine ligase
VSDIAVIFGGPSPEHDVSILTGLQAAQELQRGGHTVHALLWSKTAEWFAVDPSLEASAFLDGVPKGAQALRLVSGAGGGFEGSGGRFSKQKGTEFEVAVVCCHGGPGEDGTLQAALDGAGIAYTGPSVAAAALGMDKLAFGGVMVAAGIASLPRVALTATTDGVGFDGPYIVKPRFGGSSIGIVVVEDIPTAKALLAHSVHLRAGAVLEPFRPDLYDVQMALRCWPQTEMSAIERPLRSAGRAGSASNEILGYTDKYVGGEGMASAPRELPADLPATVADGVRQAARRDRISGERDQHHSRVVGPLPVDRSRRALRAAARRHDRRSDRPPDRPLQRGRCRWIGVARRGLHRRQAGLTGGSRRRRPWSGVVMWCGARGYSGRG